MSDSATDPVGQALAQVVSDHAPVDVVDIGGGSGTRAVPLALLGCRVLVVDTSTDALASLARRAADAGVSGSVSALQADADHLDAVLAESSADLVLYHHMAQEVDDPASSLAAATRLLRPGGRMSVLVPGRLSAALVSALSGRYAEASAILSGADRTYDVPGLRHLLEAAGLVVDGIAGVGVVAALSGGRLRGSDDDALQLLEADLAKHPVLGQLGGDLHAWGIRPASSP